MHDILLIEMIHTCLIDNSSEQRAANSARVQMMASHTLAVVEQQRPRVVKRSAVGVGSDADCPLRL